MEEEIAKRNDQSFKYPFKNEDEIQISLSYEKYIKF